MLWDIFCRVVDNYGDAGFCWRLCADLASRGETVRLWIDDPSPLAWMAPDGAPHVAVAEWNGQTRWPAPGDVVVEAFGCGIAPEFIASFPALERCAGVFPLWIDLQYLSAERFGADSHGLPSPVVFGPGSGHTRYYFFPGFTLDTGGLLREPGLLERQAGFDRNAWLRARGVEPGRALAVSLFCYEPPALRQLLLQLAARAGGASLLVAAGRGQAATRAAQARLDRDTPHWNAAARLDVCFLPLMPQREFDHLLWACDFNFVRGEDSWVRALWAGKPFVWQAYPQDDGAAIAKVAAFGSWMEYGIDFSAAHWFWNGFTDQETPLLPATSTAAVGARARLLAQPDLVTRLLAFATEKR